MRTLLIAAAFSALAVAGCQGGSTNYSSGGNTTGTNKIEAPVANSSGVSTTNPQLAQAAARCEQQLSGMGQLPPNVNPARLCACAIDTAFAGREDPTYAQTPEGRQALMQATATCLQREMAGGASGNN